MLDIHTNSKLVSYLEAELYAWTCTNQSYYDWRLPNFDDPIPFFMQNECWISYTFPYSHYFAEDRTIVLVRDKDD